MSEDNKEPLAYLNEVNLYMPWALTDGTAWTHVMAEFPTLTEAEAKRVVDIWKAQAPRLLNENT